MELHVDGGAPLNGVARVPADKSILHRALMFGAMASGRCQISARAPGADNLSTAAVLRQLGVGIEPTADGLEVTSPGIAGWREPASPLDCGNSGTTMRLMTGILAGRGLPAVLVGDASLSRRPMGRVCEPLRQLGADVRGEAAAGRELPPLRVGRGSLRSGSLESPVASAQVKSALLLAGLGAGVPLTVSEPHRSRDHTERMLRAMGVTITTTAEEAGKERIALTPGPLRICDFVAPGDVSSAAFLLAAATLVPGSQVTVQDVGLNGTRTGLLEILEEYGAGPAVSGWREVGGEPLGDITAVHRVLQARQHGDQPTRVAGDVIPRLIDELVVLAAIAAQAEGTTVIADAEELRVKESDRIEETARLLAAFGVEVRTAADGLTVTGPQPLRPADVDVSSDHRIALTGAVLALAAPGASVLRGFDVASVSFPDLPEVLTTLGARLRLVG